MNCELNCEGVVLPLCQQEVVGIFYRDTYE